MKWYLAALKKYCVFSGRASRKEFWMFVLINWIISIILSFVDKAIGTEIAINPQESTGILSSIYSLAVFLPSLSVSVRRLHDTGRSGWWVLLPLLGILAMFVTNATIALGILIITVILLIVWYALPGTPGSNRYGEPSATQVVSDNYTMSR